MKTESKTLLVPFLLGRDLAVFSSKSSKRSGALRFLEGCDLEGVGVVVFLGADFLRAGFFIVALLFGVALALLLVLFECGVLAADAKSSSSPRALFGLCLAAQLAPVLEVGVVVGSGGGACACCVWVEESGEVV